MGRLKTGFVSVPAPAKRAVLLGVLANMPEEAFGWLVVEWMQGRPFPDGIGGFQNASRESITKLKAEGKTYAEGQP